MTVPYKADEATRRTRLEALQAAQWHVGQDYRNREDKMAAAEELVDYGCFTASQITDWLGLSRYALEDTGRVKGWGAAALSPDQFDMAISLAKCGLEGIKPKTLIFQAHRADMSFDLIGGLLGIHKNICRRIVRRIEGLPWS